MVGTTILVLASLLAVGKPQPPPVGIACYGRETIDYRRPGRPSVKAIFGEPVTVAVAPEPMGWGFYQFPTITRWDDGRLFVTFAVSQDSIKCYGSATADMVSHDNGATWSPQTGEQGISGLLLPNGDRIVITTPKALPIADLKLPPPLGTVGDTYNKNAPIVYRLTELPAELQTVRLNRMAKGSNTWTPEQAKLIDPQALRYSLAGLFPILFWGDVRVAPDKSLIAGIYPGYRVLDDGSVDPKDGTFFYRSTDNGHTWTIQGRIPYQPDLKSDPKGANRMGFTEPAFEILADGSLLCVMRTSDGLGVGPMYASRSNDLGKTWSKPEAMTPNGVLPKLLRLGNGVLVLSSGRPGVQVRFATDGKGKQWTDPFEMVPKIEGGGDDSCGYTSLLTTGPDSFIIAYSHFKHRTADGQTRKAILVREVKVQRG
jgi:hypothetical protein